jgi:hypothetical protein
MIRSLVEGWFSTSKATNSSLRANLAETLTIALQNKKIQERMCCVMSRYSADILHFAMIARAGFGRYRHLLTTVI